MKKTYMLILYILISINNMAQENYEAINTNEFFEKATIMEKNILIDVQTKDDFAVQHINNAINLDNIKELKNYTDSLSKDTVILVYCLTDFRSRKAANLLFERGFKYIYILKGGLEKWIDSGLPIFEKE